MKPETLTSYIVVVRLPGNISYIPNAVKGGQEFASIDEATAATDAYVARNYGTFQQGFRAYVIDQTESNIIAATGNLKPQALKWERF